MTGQDPQATGGHRGKPARPFVIGWLVLLLAGCVATAWAALDQPSANWSGPVLSGAITGGVLVLAIAPVAILMSRRSTDQSASELRRIAEGIHEHTMLSDASKRMVYRDRELDLLRMLIEQDIGAGEFDAALRLVDELSSGFGRLEESETYRSRIEEARHADVELNIRSGLQDINRRLEAGDWNQAILVARRLQRLFPDAPDLTDLETHVMAARRRRAANLAQTLDDARAEDRIEDAMQLLKELDRHVDSEEASRLAPVAEEVIGRHRETLGIRFKQACETHDWAEAVRIGEQITREYPNSRMTNEIQAMLGDLRHRAGYRE